MANSYKKTDWVDHIVDPETLQVIQEGTRFTANRANNIEDGIYRLHDSQDSQDKEIQRLRVQLEMVGRTPINNGTFFDSLSSDAPKNLIPQAAGAVLQTAVAVGVTILSLDSSPFETGQQVIVYDDVNQESTRITAMDGTAKKITVTALTKAYKKGAKVARNNSVINRSLQEIGYGEWGTYTVTVSEVS